MGITTVQIANISATLMNAAYSTERLEILSGPYQNVHPNSYDNGLVTLNQQKALVAAGRQELVSTTNIGSVMFRGDLPYMTTRTIAAFSTAQIRALTTDAIAVFTTAQLRALTTVQIDVLSATQLQQIPFGSFTSTQATAMSTSAIANFSSDVWEIYFDEYGVGLIDILTTKQLAAVSTTAMSLLDTRSIEALTAVTTRLLPALSTAQLSAITTSGIQALNSASLSLLQTAQLQGITTTQIAALTTTQVAYLSTGFLNNLSSSQIRALESRDVAALSTKAIVSLNTLQIVALGTQGIAALTTTQVGALTTTQFNSLTTNQIRAIETVDVASMTTAQIKAISSSQLSALSSSQIASFGLTTTVLMSLTSSALSTLNSTQINTLGSLKRLTPIVLDLHDNGINTTSLKNGATFDLANTGQAVKTGWITNGDGLLVLDINGDGIINNGGELFGEGTVLSNGQKAKDGYQAMSALDTNHDGVLNNADKAFSQLQVWVDNGDGITQRGELHLLTELGISSISLTSQASAEVDNGNLIGLMGSFTTADGKTHTMGDVWFQTDSSGNRVFDLAEVVAANKASINHGTVNLVTDQSSTLAVGLSDVLSYGQTDGVGTHQLVIDGGHYSAVNLTHGGDWSLAGHIDSGGEQYSVFVDQTHHAKLLINDKISLLL